MNTLQAELEEILHKFIQGWNDGTYEQSVVAENEAVSAILSAIAAKLPKEKDTDGATGKYVNGWNDCLAEVKALLGEEK